MRFTNDIYHVLSSDDKFVIVFMLLEGVIIIIECRTRAFNVLYGIDDYLVLYILQWLLRLLVDIIMLHVHTIVHCFLTHLWFIFLIQVILYQCIYDCCECT